MADQLNTTPWVPFGYHEEERSWFPLLTWSGKHMWWIVRLIGRLNPEWSSRFAIFALSHWPRIRYHILVGQATSMEIDRSKRPGTTGIVRPVTHTRRRQMSPVPPQHIRPK